MKIDKQKLIQIIKEEVQAELDEELLNEDWFDRLVKWLTGTTAGQKVLDRANATHDRVKRSGAGSAYGKIPNR